MGEPPAFQVFSVLIAIISSFFYLKMYLRDIFLK